MIIEILELAAALEWITLGVLVFFKLRSLRRRLEAALKDLEDSIRGTHGRNLRPRFERAEQEESP